MCHADEHWAEALPLVLLVIRSAWKEDLLVIRCAWKEELKASSAELVYGSPLWLPGEYFATSPVRMHQRPRLRVPAEGPHWKASPHTSFPACCAIHVHFQGPGHRLACWRTSSMLTQNRFHHRPFLLASRLALEDGYASRITCGYSGLSGGGGTSRASPPT